MCVEYMLQDIPGDADEVTKVDAVFDPASDLDPVAETVDVREASAERLFVAETRPVFEPIDRDIFAVDVELVVTVFRSDLVIHVGDALIVIEIVLTAVVEPGTDLDGDPVLYLVTIPSFDLVALAV